MASRRKDQIRSSYDAQVQHYIDHSTMQQASLSKLLCLISSAPKSRAENNGVMSVLDVGCGTGIAVKLLRQKGWFDKGIYLGLDLSPKMIDIARSNFQNDSTRFEVADAEHLPCTNGSFGIVMTNSMLHWLNQPKYELSVSKTIRELGRVVSPDGIVGGSIAGKGTGSQFLSYYHRLMEEIHETPGFSDQDYVEDPVGCMALDQIVEEFLHAGLEIHTACMDYEPVIFDSSSSYVDAIEAYGFDVFMAPIPTRERAHFWSELKRRFVRAFEMTPYRHDQYMAYILAKPAR